MQSQKITRRKTLTGAGAAAGALAIAGPAPASEGTDVELKTLWGLYVEQYRAYEEAIEIARERRTKFDSAHPERYDPDPDDKMLPGDRWASLKPERIKYGVDTAYDVREREHINLIRITKRIRKVKAETMFGVGVKLTVSEHFEEHDLANAVIDALSEIGRITGTDFLATSGEHLSLADWS